MRKLISLLCMLMVFVMCKEADATYEGHYPKTTFVKVLADLYVAEGALKDVDVDLKDSLIAHYRSQIEAIHKVELDIVEKDLEALQSDPKLYKKIHSIVSDSVVFMEKRLNQKKEKKITKPELDKN